MKNVDIDLIERAASGDAEAFTRLYSTKARDILFSTYKVIGNMSDAEDAAQEVVIRMYKNIKHLKDPKAFHSWVQRIATNVCYDFLKKNKHAGHHEDISAYEDTLESEYKEFLPQEYAESSDIRQTIREIIEELPARRRRAIIMYYYDDMTYEEIAYAMKLKVNSVGSSISESKKTIKEELKRRIGKEADILPSFAALPVVTQILREEAIELIPDAKIAMFNERCNTAVHGLITKGSSVHRLCEVIVLAATGAIIVVAIIFGVSEFSIPSEEKAVTVSTVVSEYDVNNGVPKDGRIDFIGGECDCGHVNPKEAIVVHTEKDYGGADNPVEVWTWNIRNSDDKIVSTGTGSEISEALTELKDQKQYGSYTAIFEGHDAYGNRIEIRRGFLLNDKKFNSSLYK